MYLESLETYAEMVHLEEEATAEAVLVPMLVLGQIPLTRCIPLLMASRPQDTNRRASAACTR